MSDIENTKFDTPIEDTPTEIKSSTSETPIGDVKNKKKPPILTITLIMVVVIVSVISIIFAMQPSKEDKWWDTVKTRNTLSDYRNYQNLYPEGKYINDAKTARANLHIDSLINSNVSLDDQEAFLKTELGGFATQSFKDKILEEVEKEKKKLTDLNNLFNKSNLTTYLLNEANRLNFKWYKVSSNLLDIFPKTISTENGEYNVNEGSTQIIASNLSWGEDIVLFRLVDDVWNNELLAIYYLFDKARYLNGEDDALIRLNGTSPPIHAFNKLNPPNLNKNSAADYIKFFCFFVWGEEGPFYIVESIQDPMIQRSSKLIDIMTSKLKPIRFKKERKGNFFYEAIVYYSDALFRADFEVEPRGMIYMLNDNPIKNNLPDKIDIVIN